MPRKNENFEMVNNSSENIQIDFPEIIAITNKLNMSGAKAVQSGQSTTKSGVINPILMIRQGENEFRLNKNYQNKEICFQKKFKLNNNNPKPALFLNVKNDNFLKVFNSRL